MVLSLWTNGHERHNCIHPPTIDITLDSIGYGPWLEGYTLKFTSILWSQTWQELRDTMEEENMIVDLVT